MELYLKKYEKIGIFAKIENNKFVIKTNSVTHVSCNTFESERKAIIECINKIDNEIIHTTCVKCGRNVILENIEYEHSSDIFGNVICKNKCK